ncbi:hypothetical protein AAZX31_13G183600 [Glycine max]|uniref:Uncharacterized protein n=3 Tax=Glycine subgen. Soja TaxID=1462606 RepID=K7M0T3_SOYBN|nr:uncharacterized protein LOC102668262 [Glycine max]XP_028187427.1 uncharacterized protein LOC114374036 [Glycine soja]KAG4960097.1 hypothetical protein JHK87_036730 [Glycine soja]KAG4971112.1 hypothetical protein JHK85_037533 [Glycine max]KAG4977512.1 hypothetical protein JHK86_036986 [Glycine max]KAG5113513.1 hypothetical protein JHK82_036782 [Glycine max]KAG5130790.1 hypothetical protein JHK84_037187 [Glycine max]|eukprot:XP_006594406.1 uncharacterized protein LOC102668262 [Glycine max]
MESSDKVSTAKRRQPSPGFSPEKTENKRMKNSLPYPPEKHFPSEVHDDSATKTGQIIPFTGSGRRLFDGKLCTRSVEETSSSMLNQTTKKEEEPKFQAFTGKKYSLIN